MLFYINSNNNNNNNYYYYYYYYYYYNVDTKIKEKPTNRDIKNINKAIENVMEKNKVSEIDQPFVYLWMANCILYAVVVAFLLAKNWKKNRNSQTEDRGKK